MAAPPSICTQITIDATNCNIDLDDGGGEDTATIDAGTYADIWAVCENLEGKIQAIGGAAYATATVDPYFSGSVPGTIRFRFGDDVDILWKTGTNGTTGTDTSCAAVVGFDDTLDDEGASQYISDYQHMYGWYALRYPKSYGPEKREALGGELRIPLSSQSAKKVHIGFRRHYKVELVELVPELMWAADATGSDVNRDLETVWQAAIQGDYVRYREDQEVEGTYTDYYLREPASLNDAVTRPHQDYESYNVNLDFVRKEA